MDSDQRHVIDDHQEGLTALSQSLRISLLWLFALIVVVIFFIAFQSFFIVKQHEVGLIYHFGKLRGGPVGTGLHFVWPYPIESTEVLVVDRDRILESKAFMFIPGKADSRIPTTLRPGADGFLLTGDRNIIHAICKLTYSIDRKDPEAMLSFYVRNLESERLLLGLLDNSVVQVAARTDTDGVFKVDEFRRKVESLLKVKIQQSGIGVVCKSIAIDPLPARQAKAAFDALKQVADEQDTVKQQALSYGIKVKQQAESQRQVIIAEANSEKLRKVAAAQADSANFKQRLRQFKKNPELISRTIYEEALFRIFKHTDEKFIVDRASGRQVRIMLGRNLDKQKESEKSNDQ